MSLLFSTRKPTQRKESSIVEFPLRLHFALAIFWTLCFGAIAWDIHPNYNSASFVLPITVACMWIAFLWRVIKRPFLEFIGQLTILQAVATLIWTGVFLGLGMAQIRIEQEYSLGGILIVVALLGPGWHLMGFGLDKLLNE